MLGAIFLPRAALLGGALAIVVAAVVMTALLSGSGSPASAQDANETKVPAKPAGLSVATEPGSLDVLADWDDVAGADDYLVRWRPKDGQLNEGARTQSSSASITVSAYGDWVVRIQACNDAGCGKPTAERFSVEPAPEPTPTPTPNTPNKPPVFDRNNIRIHTVLENYGPLITAGTYVVRDPENDRITRSLAGADAASFAARQFPSGNELIIDLELNATPDYESPADANGDGVYEVTIRATDANGSGETTELDVTVTVLDVDEAPVITGPAAVSFAEHSGSDVGQYSAADPEGETATLTLGGTDAASFTFADGTLTFNAAPDYETRDSYSVTFTASDGTNTATLDVTITITDVDETTINLGPVVDVQAERYQGFTGTDHAPRGILVSKVFDGIFSDPNGDELTYTVSVPDDRSELVDTVYVPESVQRVFIRLDAEDDWGAVRPALPKPLVTTVTLTATDPDGLSASVTGEFRTNWESSPTLVSVCDRTSQVKGVLVKLLGKACENIGADDLSAVVTLDLSNTGLRSLRTEDFSGMSSLRNVDASNNSITSWTDACAADYGDTVQNVNLTNNKLGGTTGDQIPAGCFTATKFPELRSLHLGATRINSLSGDPFDGLTKLEILDLSQNQITAVPVAAFGDLSELWYLDLGRNALTSSGLPVTTSGSVVTGAVFDDLQSLEWLALNNQFTQDSSNNFEPTGNAQLTSLDVRVFSGLVSLKELDLANNGLTTAGLPNNVFANLPSLESLALFGNAGNASTPWTVAQLITMGVRNDGTNLQADVFQVVASPTGFEIEPVSGGVKLTWDDPSDSNLSHEYRYDVNSSGAWTDWTAISSPTDNGATLEHTVSSNMTSGKNYVFQLRSEKSGAHSWRANADCTAVFGTSGNDTLTGSVYPDCIIGLAGNDTLEGHGGADQLDGGAGTDTASYAGSDNGVEVDLSISTAQAAYGNTHSSGDVLSNIENITGSDYPDTLTGDSSANVLKGGDGNDTLKGGAADDFLEGNQGDDKIYGEGGADDMFGGFGDDLLEGGDGGDELGCQDGIDTVSYSGSNSGVTVTVNGAASGGHAAGDTISNCENIIGSAHADTLTGNANANVIEGGASGDTLNGAGGSDTISYAGSSAGVTFNHGAGTASGGDANGDTWSNFENILGSAHADTLTGNANANVIEGGAGGDALNGAGGTDTVSYAGSSAAVTVTINGTTSGGDAAGDTISNFENILGSAHADTLTGDANANVVEGGAGGDTLDCAGDTDTLSYAGARAGVTVTINGTGSRGDANGDSISNCENVTGSAHADSLTGDANVNVIAGGDGDDVIEGRAGADTMTGGAGTDTLSYRNSVRPVYANFGDDEYEDNEAQDDVVSGFENLVGSKGGDELVGDANANVIWGLAGQDEIDCRAGDDVVDGGPGGDEMDGGAGTDTLTYADSPGPVFLNLSDSSASRGCYAAGDTVENIEKIIGTRYDDFFTSTSGGITFDGGAGGDTIIYRSSDAGVTVNLTTGTGSGGHAVGDKYTSIEHIVGSPHNDTLTGDAGNNSFEGMGGTDTIDGKGGYDTLTFNRVAQGENEAGADSPWVPKSPTLSESTGLSLETNS